MNNVFNKKLTLIFLALICIMQSFSVLIDIKASGVEAKGVEANEDEKANHLQNIYAKLMIPLRTVKSLATKKAIIMVMITITALCAYSAYQTFPELIGTYELFRASEFNKTKVLETAVFLYDEVCICTKKWTEEDYSHIETITDHCKCTLQAIGLGEHLSNIFKLVNLICKSSTWCNALRNILPNAVTSWSKWEYLYK